MLKSLLNFAQDLLPAGAVEERRGTIRMQCQLLVEVNTPAGMQLSTVTDLSPKGMRLEGPTKLPQGHSLQVALPKSKFGEVNCQVVWCKPVAGTRNFTLGLSFADTGPNLAKSWLKEKLRELGFDAGKINERRNFIRFPAPNVEVLLVDGVGDVLAEGRLVNFGYGGALVALVSEVSCGTGVRIVIEATQETPAVDTLAVVRSFYKSAKKFYVTGLQFAKPSEAQVKRFVRASKKKMEQ